jgi:ankyrin repeat protein
MSYLKKYYKYKSKQLGGSLPSEPSEKLLFILTTCVQNHFFVEVKPFINLNKSFRNDAQLLSANSKSLGKTNLMGAAFTGDIARITKLLKYYNINNADHLGYTPLIIACENGKNDDMVIEEKIGTEQALKAGVKFSTILGNRMLTSICVSDLVRTHETAQFFLTGLLHRKPDALNGMIEDNHGNETITIYVLPCFHELQENGRDEDTKYLNNATRLFTLGQTQGAFNREIGRAHV